MALRRIFHSAGQRQWRALCPCRVAVPAHRLTGTVATVEAGQLDVSDDFRDLSILAERHDLDMIDTPALNLKPSFNLAAYVNKSDTLQQLVKLGVDLHRLEKKPDLAQFVLGLDFQKQIQPHLQFLHDIGIVPDELGPYLTKNPAILQQNIDDLRVRITYLQSKKFKANEIERIVQKNPFWLMFSTPKIDDRLGFFQRQFFLTGAETRQLAVAQPRIITYSIEHIRKATFTVVEEMGMTKQETKELILKLPKILTMDPVKTVDKFDYLHNKMKIPHRQLIEEPLVFLSRQHRLEQRHKFLCHLGKAQYDRTKPLYTSLTTLVSGTDEEYVMNVAKSNLSTYEAFLRTL